MLSGQSSRHLFHFNRAYVQFLVVQVQYCRRISLWCNKKKGLRTRDRDLYLDTMTSSNVERVSLGLVAMCNGSTADNRAVVVQVQVYQYFWLPETFWLRWRGYWLVYFYLTKFLFDQDETSTCTCTFIHHFELSCTVQQFKQTGIRFFELGFAPK